ncbi:hypothetical protein ES705_08945 [subsurface metagenome]
MHNKNTRVILFTLISSMLIGGYFLFLNSPRFLGANMASFEDIFYQNSKRPKISAFDESIFIDGNDMFAAKAISEGWSGDGSLNDPYIVENYTILAISEHGIEIRNTNLHFIIRNVSITNGRSNYYHGFYLYNVINGILTNNTADNNLAGFLLVNSDNIFFSDNVAINNLHGFRFWHSNYNTLANSTANSNLEYGIYLDNSNYNNITRNILFFNEIGGIFEVDCVGNDISYNRYTPETFFLESDSGEFDADGTFTLTWTVSQNADNYTLYQNGGILAEGLTVTEYNITDLSPGTYEFYVKAFNINGEVDSNIFKVIVKFHIIIDGNLDFHQTAIENNFTGDGSLNDPYVIENYEISAAIEHGVLIKNTNLHFIIRDVTVNDSILNKHCGFYLENVTHGRLEDNTAYNNQYGFYLKNSFNNTLITNTAIGNTNGLMLDCSYLNILTANIIIDNRHGFSLESSYNNIISGNEVINNTYLGFYLRSSYNNILTENLATGNLNGFTLSYSDLNNFTNNTANNNDQHGFRLSFSHYNNLIENSASYNQKYGIYLEESTFNVITGNILKDNGIGAIYEKFTDDTDYPDVFLIAVIIFIIALFSIILIKLVFFIKRKNIKFIIPKLSLKKRKE